MIIGITGSIACGKTIVLNYLKLKGYQVISLDDISHEVFDEKDVNDIIKKEFCIQKEGNVTRGEIGDIVFNDEVKLKRLNEILHPLILERMNKEIKIAKSVKGTLFIEVPLLYECKLNNYFDKVWFIYVNKGTQIKRLMDRNKISIDEALNRIDKQIDVDKKMQLAIMYNDYIIDNNSDLVYTYSRIDEFLNQIQ